MMTNYPIEEAFQRIAKRQPDMELWQIKKMSMMEFWKKSLSPRELVITTLTLEILDLVESIKLISKSIPLPQPRHALLKLKKK